MRLHSQAALTIRQRIEVKRRHVEDGIPVLDLAEEFRVNPTTVQRWIGRESPLDRSSAPIQHHTVVTDRYRAAVIAYRKEHPRHGPIRIAQELRKEFSEAHRGTVLRVLQEEGLTRPQKKERAPGKHIPVGHHRIQMDIQQLPAVEGGKGFEYKITMIHLRTRLKYSEIHPDRKSATVVGVFRRGLDLLPPFFSSGPTTDSSSP